MANRVLPKPDRPKRGIAAVMVLGLGYILFACLCASDSPIYITVWGKTLQVIASLIAMANCLGFVILSRHDTYRFRPLGFLLTVLFLIWWWTADQDWGPLESAMRVLGIVVAGFSAGTWLMTILFKGTVMKGSWRSNWRR